MAKAKRYYLDGFVGIVLSNSEHGWSTYSSNSEIANKLLFDPEIVELVLDEWDDGEIDAYCHKTYYKNYVKPPGFLNLKVEFIPEGKQFIVLNDKDGEYIKFLKDITIFHS